LASILLVGASFRTSGVDYRERLASLFDSEGLASEVGAEEAVTLVTCNRVELYLYARDPDATAAKVRRSLPSPTDDPQLYVKDGSEAVLHLFRVAAGLDSMVREEDQVSGQVRRASKRARVEGSAGSVLSTIFDAAVAASGRLGPRRPGRGSLSELAVDAALEKLGGLPRKALIVGTGEMAKIAATKLPKDRVWVATRRDELPPALAGCRMVRYEDARAFAAQCDLVVSATKSGSYALKRDGPGFSGRVVLVDLGFPRNIDPRLGGGEQATLMDLDYLATVADRHAERADPAKEEAIEEEAARFERRLIATRLSPVVPGIFAWGDQVRSRELGAAMRRLPELTEEERRIVEAMAKRISSKLLSKSVAFARGSSERFPQKARLELLSEMFGRNGE
jgi:glutamyl-tRNA reductase